MAVFNPSPPQTNDPNYIGWSKPISQPMANTSSAVAIKGAGDLMTEGVSAVNELEHKYIDNTLHDQIDSERSAYTQALQQADAKVRPGGQTDANGLPAGGSLLDTASSSKVPGDLKTFPNTLEALQGARANGRISETYYFGRLDQIAKDMRSRFPGQRDYIDSKVSNITGVTPANAYIKSMIGDISSFTSNANAAKNKVESQVLENIGTVGAHNWQLWKAGQMSDETIMNMIAIRKKQDADLSLAEKERTAIKGNREILGLKTEDTFTKYGYNAVGNAMDDVMTGTGLTGTKGTDLLRDIESGKVKVPEQQARAIGESLMARRQQISAQFDADLAKSRENGSTWGTDMGPEKAQTLKNTLLAPLDNFSKWIYDQNFGPAFRSANFVKAVTQGAEEHILSDKDIGPYIAVAAGIHSMSGDKFTADLFEQSIKTGMATKWTGWVSKIGSELIFQPGAKQGQTNTVTDAINEARQKNAPKQVFQTILDSSKSLTDPKLPDQVKENLAKGFFDPKNAELLNLFDEDHTDPATGRWVPGKYTVFSRLTNPAVTSEMKRLGEHNPEVWNNYKTTMTNQFAGLFRKEINDLNDIQEVPGLKMTWDSDKHQIGIKYPGLTGTPNEQVAARFRQGNDPRVRQINDSIKKLNMGLFSVANVAAANGTDPDAQVVHLLTGMGFDPSKTNVAGIPQGIINAIVSSRADKSQEYWTKSNYSEEDKPKGDLKSFLQNPSGQQKPQQSNQPSMNLGEILGSRVDNIPEGMSARDFIKQLQREGR